MHQVEITLLREEMAEADNVYVYNTVNTVYLLSALASASGARRSGSATYTTRKS